MGPLRVWPGGLAVSRSVGDRDGKKGGVTSKPEVSRVYVPDEQPGFRLVMASDGLWDAVTVKQAAACGAKLGTAPAAAALCKLAQKQKDNRDDITVVVVDALASVGHKDPFVAKAPWRSEIKARWPLGHRKYDTVPSPSARRAARTDAAAREAAVEAAAAPPPRKPPRRRRRRLGGRTLGGRTTPGERRRRRRRRGVGGGAIEPLDAIVVRERHTRDGREGRTRWAWEWREGEGQGRPGRPGGTPG